MTSLFHGHVWLLESTLGWLQVRSKSKDILYTDLKQQPLVLRGSQTYGNRHHWKRQTTWNHRQEADFRQDYDYNETLLVSCHWEFQNEMRACCRDVTISHRPARGMEETHRFNMETLSCQDKLFKLALINTYPGKMWYSYQHPILRLIQLKYHFFWSACWSGHGFTTTSLRWESSYPRIFRPIFFQEPCHYWFRP